jgi:shikimate dehydrogenase
MSRHVGLIGYPIKHSISPYFQQAALDYYQLDIIYELWETTPETLVPAVVKIKEHKNLGANVTVPYKEAVLPLLDEVDELASLIGAVNTIVKKGDRLLGFNSDAYGFIEALDKEGHFNPEGRRVVILGAGGVARAVGFALVQKNANSLVIVNRTFRRAQVLADSLAGYSTDSSSGLETAKTKIAALPWRSLGSEETFSHCQLIINCTTMGMKHSSQEGKSPLSLEVIPRGVLVCDLVYNPWPTPLLELAQKAGADILGGLSMLVYQGAASFKLWTGREAPFDIMFSRARELLRGGK